jgi:hypothetical protein
MAVAGALTELAADLRMERRLDPVLRRSYASGAPRALHLAARACAVGGAGLVAGLGGRSRAAAVGGGAALVAAAALQRWAIFRAGIASARDPEQTVAPQRARTAGTNGQLTNHPSG